MCGLNCDILIKNGKIVDGTASPWFKGDVAIKGEKILGVGKQNQVDADLIVDAKGVVVSPGFIDLHSHSEFQLLINPQADSLVRQGITTIMNGVCGFSAAPIKNEHLKLFRLFVEEMKPRWSTLREYYDQLEMQGIAINTGSFVGLGNCRISAMGADAWDRSPTGNELEEMKKMIADAMKDGAFGLSSGLEYPPQTIVETDEIIELAKVARSYGGIYATHIRNRDIKVVAAAREAIEIGEKAEIPVQGSHFGARFPSDGKTKIIVDLFDNARKKGIDVAFDQIPWTIDKEGIGWSGCSMVSLIVSGSKYTSKGGQITLEMLKTPEVVEFLKKDLPNRQYGPILAGTRGLLDTWDRVLLIQCWKNPQYNGKNLKEIGEMMGKDPFYSLIEILVAEGEDFNRVWGTVGITSKWDTNFSLLHPFCSVTGDTGIDAPYGPLSKEPINEIKTRAYGQFPYFFEKWVREDRLITLEEAVRKCSGLPAQRVRLMNRGLLRPGMFADIVIFDHMNIRNKSTWSEPRQYPVGIEKVLVNGKIVIDKNRHTGILNGKILRLNPV